MKLILPIAFLQGLSYAAGCTFTVTSCDYAAVKAYVDANTDCAPDIDAEDLETLVEEECDDVEKAKLEWTDVATEAGNPRNYQWDDNYFDGGTTWNDEKETTTETLKVGDSGSVERTWKYHASNKMIGWPTDDPKNEYYSKNWQGCSSRVAMCCFTASRMGEELPVNADVCSHDLEDSKDSNHINKGFAVFHDYEEKAYCTGFAWSADENSTSAKYKGNALFYASMYSNLYEKGYVENIPSSPMCACVEQMATVTDSDCVEVKATEGSPFKVMIEGNETVSIKELATVTYQKCDAGNLVEHYKTVATDEEVTKLTTDHIVGDCSEENKRFVNEKFFKSGSRPEIADLTKWTLVVGKGKYYFPPVGETAFREALAASPNNIVRRVCPWCYDSHKDVYYKRLTQIPPASEYDFLTNFMDMWFDTNNVLGVDFNLYSSYEDALADTGAWTYCNYNDNRIGFPRDCGPTAKVGWNWNSYMRSNWRTDTHAFLVEKADATSST